ncbi:MAG TPA: heparinase II/III family protein, partial [Candidatus Krumholzibacterium sp.]|nr:heparinase II/III family protein [Candidatus Krumholzibacterium sp.]
DVLANATHAFRETGDRSFIDRGVRLIVDFHSDNLDNMDLPSPYSWYDHSVAYRTIHLIDFWNEYLRLGERDERFILALLELVWRQGLYLEKDKYYSKRTNHGIYSNIAQLRLAIAFPQFRGAALWKRTALDRMEGQILDNYTAEGIHKEYSPSYHVLTTKLLCRFRDDCAADETIGLPASFDSLIVKARRNIVWLLHPEGRLSLIGDSSLGTIESITESLWEDEPALEWMRTGGKGGSPPQRRSIGFPEAQLFVMRSGWGRDGDPGTESCLIADYCPNGKAHQHDDYLSFEYSALGVRWFTDLGVFNYNTTDAGRKFVISARAHNLIVPLESTRRIAQNDREVPGRTASAEGGGRFKEILDRIETMPDPSGRVAALLQVRDRVDGRLRSRLLIMLALSYEELGESSDKARDCLQEVIDEDGDGGYAEIALQLMEMLDVRVEDLKFDDSSDMDVHESADKTAAGPLLTEVQNRPSGPGNRGTSEGEDDKGFGLVSSRSVLKPDHGQRPVIHYWIEEDDYCYLEGSYQYSRQFRHG